MKYYCVRPNGLVDQYNGHHKDSIKTSQYVLITTDEDKAYNLAEQIINKKR